LSTTRLHRAQKVDVVEGPVDLLHLNIPQISFQQCCAKAIFERLSARHPPAESDGIALHQSFR
jgi:hypothetical protein